MTIKGIKKLLKILGYTLGVLLVLFICLFFWVRTTGAQTWIAGQVTSWLEDKLGSRVSIEKVEIDFFDRLVLEGIYIEDLHGDTLLYARKVKVMITGFNRSKQKATLEDILIEDSKIGIARYAEDSVLNYQFILDEFASKDTTKKDSAAWDIKFGDVHLNRVDFSYRDYRDTSSSRGINFADLYVSDIKAEITGIKQEMDSTWIVIKSFEGVEKSGFLIRQLATNLQVQPSRMDLKNLWLATNSSLVSTDLAFLYDTPDDFNRFVRKVKMKADFSETRLSIDDLGYFAPELKGFERSLTFTGKVSGSVSKLKCRDMDIKFGDHTRFRGNIQMDGLPNIDETYMLVDVDELLTSKSDIERIPETPFDSGKMIKLSDNLSVLGKVKYKGRLSGYYYDLVSEGTWLTAIGSLKTNISVKQDVETREISYRGKIQTYGFNVGKLINNTELGAISMQVDVNGTGVKLQTLRSEVSGTITNLFFHGYDYKNIEVDGKLARRIFTGNLVAKDENLDLVFNGTVDFHEKPTKLDFTAKLGQANLNELHFMKSDEHITVASDIQIDLTGDNIDNIQGTIKMRNIEYIQGKEPFELGDFTFTATEYGGIKTLTLNSDVADGIVKGKFRIDELGSSAGEILSAYVTALLPETKRKNGKGKKKNKEEFEYAFEFKKTGPVTRIFMPDLSIAPGTKFNGKYNSKKGYIDMHGKSDSLSYSGMKMLNWTLEALTGDNYLTVDMKADKFHITDTVNAQNFSLSTRTANDSVKLSLYWQNKTIARNQGDIKAVVNLLSWPKISASILHTDSAFVVQDSLWNIREGNLIVMDTGLVTIKDFILYHNNQQIEAYGKISKRKDDQLHVIFRDFNLWNINPLTHKYDIAFRGTISGSATLSNLLDPSNLIFTSGLDFKKLWVNKEEIGTGSVISIYDKKKEEVSLSGDFSKYNTDEKNFLFSGKYFPNRKVDNIDMEVSIRNFGLSFFEPFLKDVFSAFKGFASGRVTITGEVDKPRINGYAVVQVKNMKIDYLNPNGSYNFNDSIFFESNAIKFENLVVNDFNGKTATVSGNIYHDNFKKFQLDLDIIADKFMIMNTTEAQNSSYYGRAFVTGRINVFGFVDQNIQIDAAIKTDKSINARNKKIEYTQFFIPLTGTSEISESEFITFISKDSTSKDKKDLKVNLTGITLNLDMEVTPDAEVQILFDPKVGDIIKAKGEGNIRMEINTLGNFNMYGDYAITEGEYLFTLKNIVNKKFRVEKGSTLKWTGSPYDAEIDLRAIYEVRTSLQVMFPDDSSGVYRRRYPVDCILIMTRTLMSPIITFDIELPTVDGSVQQEVKSYLNTEMEMNRQVFSLLVMNSFVTPQALVGFTDGKGGTGGNVGLVTGFEMLSNQVSNWLSQISTEFDFGVHYRPGDEISPDQLEVAISRHLFNDRLVIDGTVANNGVNNTGQNTNNIVGEVTAEYKLTDDGKVRVKAFNKANDNTVINTEAPYTQGVGIFYREDFETLRDLFERYLKKIKGDKPKS